MITFGPTSPADLTPDAIVAAADPSAADPKAAKTSGFGDVLQQMMGGKDAVSGGDDESSEASSLGGAGKSKGDAAINEDDSDSDPDSDPDPGAMGAVIDFFAQPTVVRAMPTQLWVAADAAALRLTLDTSADASAKTDPDFRLKPEATAPNADGAASQNTNQFAADLAVPTKADAKALPREKTNAAAPQPASQAAPDAAAIAATIAQAPATDAAAAADTTSTVDSAPTERATDKTQIRNTSALPAHIATPAATAAKVDAAYESAGHETKGRDRRSFGEPAADQGQPRLGERSPVAPQFTIATESRLAVSTTLSASIDAAGPAATVSTNLDVELPKQIVQSMKLLALDGGGEAHVRLRPEYLGEVAIAIKVEHGAVTATLQSETPAVRQWAQTNEATLRQGLAEHGLRLDRLIVSDEAPKSETESRDERRQQQQQKHQQSQQGSRRPRKDAQDATFEVLV